MDNSIVSGEAACAAPASRNRRGAGSIYVAAAVLGFAALVGTALWLYQRGVEQSRKEAVLTEDAKAYVRNLKLSNVAMGAAENALNQMVVEITGNIENAGNRPLQLVELFCVFYNPYGQVVLREKVPIVRPKLGGLKPGETKTFRLPFDSIPESWNQSAPQLVIAQIQFQ